MKILLVHNFYRQPGGEDAVVKQEMELLQGNGHQVTLFSAHNDDINGFIGKSLAAIQAVYNPWARRRLSRAIAAHRPDVVHVHNFFPQLSPSIFFACRQARVPVIMTLHNFRILCPTSFLYHDAKMRERSIKHSSFWTLRYRTYHGSFIGTLFVCLMVEFHKWHGTWNTRVDRLIALTAFAKRKLVEGGIAPGHIVVKGNSIADEVAQALPPGERHGALFVGRLSDEKGIGLLLDAWKTIDYPLRIAGDGPLRGRCEAEASERTVYLGRLNRDQVMAEMRKAAFLVLPSVWYEMYPITMLEASASGLPTIASRLGSLEELIEDHVTGITFHPVNVAGLRDAVQWAIAHPGEMEKMGHAARQRYEEFHTPERNYNELMSIYKDAIEEAGQA